MPSALLEEIERAITTLRPDVVGAYDPADGALIARTLHEQVQALLLGPADWWREGYVNG